MRTKHNSLLSGPALSGVVESGGKAYLSPQAKLVSLTLEGAILGDSEGTTKPLQPGEDY